MIIEGYGVRLIRLTKDDIELVRQARNSESVSRYMEFRKQISPQQQQAWFESINTLSNNYFIIEAEGKKIGLINGAQIDWEKMETGSGGIFIWDEAFRETTTPISASLLLTDTSIILGLKRTFAKVLNDNKNAITFNKMLGYTLLPDQGNEIAAHYVLEMENYISKRDKLRAMLYKMPALFKVKIYFDNSTDPLNQFYIERLKMSEFQKEFELILEV